MQLPSRKELPDYYKVISRPIDLNKIRKNIKDGKYSKLESLTDDINLLVKNAQVIIIKFERFSNRSLNLNMGYYRSFFN
jgi:hypothetical protein